MIAKVYAYYDKKMCYFSLPVCQNKTKEDVIEENIRVLKSGRCKLSPEMLDYDMYFMGTFDDKHGKFDLLPKPEYMFSLAEHYVAPQEVEGEKDGEKN